MKIVNQLSAPNLGPKVKSINAGKVVQFDKVFNKDYPPQELFLVLNVCGSYRTEGTKAHDNKVPVVSIACGNLSYVDGERRVIVMNAEVTVDGPV